jgi:hypothetical protein
MNKKLRIRIMYLILLIELVLVGYIFFRDLKIVNSLSLTKIFELVMIISLIFLLIVIIKNVQKKFKKNRYSYKLITLIGLIIVVFINKKSNEVIDFVVPRDGRMYVIDVKNMFPGNISDKVLNYTADDSKLKKMVKEYYKDIEFAE